MKKLKLLFMGTPLFAIPSLEQLHRSEHSLAAVVTQPDRPCGRGRVRRPAPVKQWALEHEISVFQPDRLKEKSFLREVEELAPDLVVVVAYGLILPRELLQLPPLGCINLHASLLPDYRGAAPIERAVMEGAKETGVTIMVITPQLDAGDIILQERQPIALTDTAGDLNERLAAAGARLLEQAVEIIAAGRAHRRPQDHRRATYAPPLSSGETCLDWTEDALSLYNRIRGLNPRPGAYTSYRGKRIKVWRAAPPAAAGSGTMNRSAGPPPGSILSVESGKLVIAAGGGSSLELLELQPAGKKRIAAADCCRGYRLAAGERLGE